MLDLFVSKLRSGVRSANCPVTCTRYVLPVTVRLGDGTTGTVNVVAPPVVKQQVLSWVSDTCAVGR